MSRKTFSANFTYNVVGALLPLATSLATVPFYIHQIGLARYGVVTITWVLLGYFGFLDFGLSRASANALAKLGHGSSRDRSPVLVTAFCCNLGLGLTGGLLLYAVGHMVLLHIVKIPDSLMAETRDAYPWMAAMLPLGMLSGVSTGALESREKFLLSNTLSTFGTIGGQIIPLICAYAIGPSLDVVIPATLLVRLASVALSYAIVIKIEWPVSLFDVSLDWVRKLFGYGSWVTVSSLLNPLFDTSNQLIIGAMLGAASVAIYSVPMNACHALADICDVTIPHLISAQFTQHARGCRRRHTPGNDHAPLWLRDGLRSGDPALWTVPQALDRPSFRGGLRAGRTNFDVRGLDEWRRVSSLRVLTGARQAARYGKSRHCGDRAVFSGVMVSDHAAGFARGGIRLDIAGDRELHRAPHTERLHSGQTLAGAACCFTYGRFFARRQAGSDVDGHSRGSGRLHRAGLCNLCYGSRPHCAWSGVEGDAALWCSTRRSFVTARRGLSMRGSFASEADRQLAVRGPCDLWCELCCKGRPCAVDPAILSRRHTGLFPGFQRLRR